MEIPIELLKEWRQSLFEAHMNGGSVYAARRVSQVLHTINDLIGDGEDVDSRSPRNEK